MVVIYDDSHDGRHCRHGHHGRHGRLGRHGRHVLYEYDCHDGLSFSLCPKFHILVQIYGRFRPCSNSNQKVLFIIAIIVV